MENDYQKQVRITDQLESSHNELAKSTDYSDDRFYSDDRLREIAENWTEQASNPIRSERSRKVCGSIALRSTFELAYRNGRIDTMIKFYKGEL